MMSLMTERGGMMNVKTKKLVAAVLAVVLAVAMVIPMIIGALA